ncbi:putative beta-glucuronosyltransferase GlcAT14A [Iris pallida]|uniref:Beta-glucuronosyltransferase GlcAT14A n=1 Tax=Iris pallida TaxID=29817 RepID=A0AAX6FWT9_IRIPA|nr:putative beta-glucuronosyltransferase GlcAT14A [Iris pallida]
MPPAESNQWRRRRSTCSRSSPFLPLLLLSSRPLRLHGLLYSSSPLPSPPPPPWRGQPPLLRLLHHRIQGDSARIIRILCDYPRRTTLLIQSPRTRRTRSGAEPPGCVGGDGGAGREGVRERRRHREGGSGDLDGLVGAGGNAARRGGDDEDRRRWDWFVTLSAADYPLVTQDDLIHVFFCAQGHELHRSY